jgi:hypothetical protein
LDQSTKPIAETAKGFSRRQEAPASVLLQVITTLSNSNPSTNSADTLSRVLPSLYEVKEIVILIEGMAAEKANRVGVLRRVVFLPS